MHRFYTPESKPENDDLVVVTTALIKHFDSVISATQGALAPIEVDVKKSKDQALHGYYNKVKADCARDENLRSQLRQGLESRAFSADLLAALQNLKAEQEQYYSQHNYGKAPVADLIENFMEKCTLRTTLTPV